MDGDLRREPFPAQSRPDTTSEPQPVPDFSPARPKRTSRATAKPAVISSIISSLETDTLTPLPDSSDFYSDAANRRTPHARNQSSEASISSRSSAHRGPTSPGFGVEYGTGPARNDDDDGLSDAAISPTVPTSRPASGLSHRTSANNLRSSSFTSKSISKPRSRPASVSTRRGQINSRRSSLSAVSIGSVPEHASVERLRSHKSWDENVVEVAHSRTSDKENESSKDSFASSIASPSKRSGGIFSLSLAERIIARNSPKPSSPKTMEHQADADAPTSKEQLPDSVPSITVATEAPNHSERRQSAASASTTSGGLSPSGETARPLSGAPGLIADSVPTRTSSLRHSLGPGPRRKGKKTRKSTMATPAMSYKTSDTIPDSKWADLGDEDETVKRIKELRERRKSRLKDTIVSEPAVEPSLENFAVKDMHAADMAADVPSDSGRQASPSRSRPNGNVMTTPALTKKVTPLPGPKGAQARGSKIPVPVPRADIGMPKHSLDSKRPLSSHSPTPSDYSSLQQLSLDYSYNDAVNRFRGAEYHAIGGEPAYRSGASSPSPLWLQGLDLPTPPKNASRPATPNKAKSIKMQKSPKANGSKQRDESVDSAKKKGRRKSMGDARPPRDLGEVPSLPRRDSIEDDIVTFLAAPRLNSKLRHPVTGRIIAFSEVGDPKGAAVFICVGMGLTRYVTAFYDELAATLGLRLITLDRPGVGGSAPVPSTDKSGPLGWAEDVFAICQHLRIPNFSLLAHSAGAVYALATALVYPHMIKGKVHLLAPWVPPSQLEAISYAETGTPAQPLPRSQRFLRVIPAPFLKAANTSFLTATSASLKPVSKRKNYSNMKTPIRPTHELPPRPASSDDRPDDNRRMSMMLMDQYMPETTPLEGWPLSNSEDGSLSPGMSHNSLILTATAVPTDPSFTYASSGLNAAEHAESQRQAEYTTRLTQRTWDLATRDSNPATDLLVCLERHRDVGFRYTDVGRDMIITHGDDDKRVPIANIKWLAAQINRRALSQSLESHVRRSRSSWADPQRSQTRCEVRVLPGEGHGLMASPSIMSDVLEEIAGYWRTQR
ncbi:unnamed protein product [Zymoseptoria tritici ST99CH_1A5]|nr:unnamed protein product [Zymoseptoria tritici ST99CH_3D7]SMR42545.1 unnamed protein product [Zymoseptoria tritici ST99CH_1E4]SMY19882.1 unnamed protein product [Zymoseptoria tritici ST99CH_1A5]